MVFLPLLLIMGPLLTPYQKWPLSTPVNFASTAFKVDVVPLL